MRTQQLGAVVPKLGCEPQLTGLIDKNTHFWAVCWRPRGVEGVRRSLCWGVLELSGRHLSEPLSHPEASSPLPLVRTERLRGQTEVF